MTGVPIGCTRARVWRWFEVYGQPPGEKKAFRRTRGASVTLRL